MKHFCTFLLILICTATYSQSNFLPGYLVTNDGEKKEVFINNRDWINNPLKFEYQHTLNSKKLEVSLEDVQEVGIGDDIKYQRFTVNYDHPQRDLRFLSAERKPNYSKETIFLKVLIEGTATLYSYSRYGEETFFYKTSNQNPEQLLYKPYNLGDGKIRFNSKYKQDLFNDLKCENITLARIDKLKYSKNQMTKLFQYYNECMDSGYFIYGLEEKKNFNFSLKAGANFVNYRIAEPSMIFERTFKVPENVLYEEKDFEPNFRIGLEAEYFLFITRSLSVFTEPTYNFYKTEKEILMPGYNVLPNPQRPLVRPNSVTIQYSAIEFPLGVKYYHYFPNEHNIFLKAGAGAIYRFSTSTIEHWDEGRTRERQEFFASNRIGISAFTGLGYTHRTGASLEIRYYPIIQAQKNNRIEMNHDNSFSIIAGYKFF